MQAQDEAIVAILDTLKIDYQRARATESDGAVDG